MSEATIATTFITTDQTEKKQRRLKPSKPNRKRIENHTIHVDPTVLFMLIERYDDTSKYFGYKLTPYPTATFYEAS